MIAIVRKSLNEPELVHSENDEAEVFTAIINLNYKKSNQQIRNYFILQKVIVTEAAGKVVKLLPWNAGVCNRPDALVARVAYLYFRLQANYQRTDLSKTNTAQRKSTLNPGRN